MSVAALIEELRARFGERSVVTDAARIEPWLTDWRGRWTGKANAMLEPASTEEVAAMVAMQGVAATARWSAAQRRPKMAAP